MLKLTLFLLPICSIFAADIVVVTLAAGTEYNRAVQVSTENKRQYCEKHGYDFICGTQSLDASRPVPWTKVTLLIEVLSSNKYKWIFWTDADSLIMNDSIRLEELIDPDYHFIIPGDYHAVDPKELNISTWQNLAPHVVNLNAGEFLLQNSPWSLAFLKECYNKPEFISHSWWEQGAMTDLLATDETNAYWSKTKLVPYRLMDSLPAGHSIGPSFTPTAYEPGDFILHFPGTRGLDNLRATLEIYAKQMVHDRKNISLSDYCKMYGYTLPSLEEEMPTLQPSDIDSMLVIGFHAGKNTVRLLEQYPKSTLYATDSNIQFYTDTCKEYCRRWFAGRVSFGEELPKDKTFDLILLNHSFLYPQCKEEILRSAQLAHSKTKIWIANYHLPGVHRAVLDCLRQGLLRIDEIHETQDEGGNIKAWIEGGYIPVPSQSRPKGPH